MSRNHTTPDGPNGVDRPQRLHEDPTSAPHVATLLQALPQEQELSEFQLARLQRNIVAGAHTRRPRSFFGVPATVGAVLLIVGATMGAAAAMVSVRWFRPPGAVVQPNSRPPTPAAPSKAKRVASVAEPRPVPVAPVDPSLAPTQTAGREPNNVRPGPSQPRTKVPDVVIAHEPDVQRGRSRFATSLAPSAGPGLAPPAATATAVEEEAAAMSGALRLLRAGDRDAAIEQLRLYVQRFPNGAFAEEAQVALISALVKSGAHAEAEAALGEVKGTASASPALRLLRAELGFASVCAAPLRLFEDVLATAPALRERALYGAAMANERCGDRARAKTLMHEFLTAFPQSPRARSIADHLRSKE